MDSAMDEKVEAGALLSDAENEGLQAQARQRREQRALAAHGVHLEESPRAAQPLRWDECDDIEITDDSGAVIYAGPRYFRCTRVECRGLVTHGMVASGGCWCGNRRLTVALRLTSEEKIRLKSGWYPLAEWEITVITPQVPLHLQYQGKRLGWGHEEWEKQFA